MICRYSNREISAHIDPSIPVECPHCNAIRKISKTKVWTDMFVYPAHQEVDSFRPRRRYHLEDGVWSIVEGEEDGWSTKET